VAEVAVAMSGGVDSSVAAALLVDAGRDAIGVTLSLGLDAFPSATGRDEEAVVLAQRVCAELGIPHVVIEAAPEFAGRVVDPFCEAYASGLTPNPCIWCNEHVKLGFLADRVKRLGVHALATGHYARVSRDADDVWLERAADRSKDQSYFLYRVSPEVLARAEFPLGALLKSDVRRIAEERGLPAASRKESQEVCFADDHVPLVGARYPASLMPGPIEDADGTALGTHRGIARYTVGQRRGLGIGGPEGPYRVSAIDAARSTLVVAPVERCRQASVLLEDPVWRLGAHERVAAQVRYRSQPVAATATPAGGYLEVVFAEPVEVLAPGQSVVLYQEDRVVGGGYVPRPGPSHVSY